MAVGELVVVVVVVSLKVVRPESQFTLARLMYHVSVKNSRANYLQGLSPTTN